MSRYVIAFGICLTICSVGQAQEGPKPDVRAFELRAVAPPQPALKYQLQFDDLADRIPGNAALLYLDAILLMGPDAKDKGANALEAYEAKDMTTFNKLAGELKMDSVLDELDLAARRDECDWQPPFRERGFNTLLPHLEPMAHGLTWLIKVRALRQIEDGQAEEALHTLRLGYEMGNKAALECVAVSALVSLGITAQMNDALVTLMNRPESPNLYWALCEFPPRQPIFRYSLDGERSWSAISVPALMKLRNGEQLSADTWRELFKLIWSVMDSDRSTGGVPRQHPDPAQVASPELLRRARREYAEVYRMSTEDVARLEPIVVMGHYYYRQYINLFDDQYKLRGLPYPLLLRMTKEEADRAKTIQDKQPDNPFHAYGWQHVVVRFAYADRQLAALTAVEALRSYAAAHDGQLPAKLADVIETPVPANPATGEPFEYRVENGAATLSDTKFEPELSYTVKVRN